MGIIPFSCWLDNKLATNPTGSSLILVTCHFPGQMAPLTHRLQAEVAANISLWNIWGVNVKLGHLRNIIV